MYTLRFVRLPIAMILMTLAAHECGAGVVSPVSGDLEVFGQQGTNSQVNSDLILGALPIGVTRTASGTGFQSTGVYMLNSSLFNIAATQSRSGLAGSTADANGQITFSVNANTTFKATGNYDVYENSAITPGFVDFIVALDDVTFSTNLFDQVSISDSTSNSSFMLGNAKGDVSAIFDGALTGTLFAGHTYKFTYDLFNSTSDLGGSDQGATATGFINLAIGNSSGIGGDSVPLPQGMWGGALAFAVMGLCSCLASLHRKIKPVQA